MVDHLSYQDARLSSFAGGFAIGFGLWTVTTAVRQTKLCRNRSRNVFIYMVWGEIAANLFMGIFSWLAVNKVISQSLAFFLVITSLWVVEIQFYFQILINRCGIVATDQRFIRKLKIGTAVLITLINISVYIIWIPACLNPPPIPVFVVINKYWDRTWKGILLLVDIALNWYFLTAVRRLIRHHGLLKYKPLVRWNACLMVVSVLMDALLIGLESLSLQQGTIVFDAFYPIIYIVKLHIELSMAALIIKITKGSQGHSSYNANSWPHGQRNADPVIIAPVPLNSGNNSLPFNGLFSGSDKLLP